MKVVMECDPLSQQFRTGIPYYIEFLCAAMLEIAAPDFDLTLLSKVVAGDPLPEYANKNFLGKPSIPLPNLPRRVLERAWRSVLAGVPAWADVQHLPYPEFPTRRRGKHTRLVCTIHDLSYKRFPDVIENPKYLQHLHRALETQTRKSDALIAGSLAAKNDVIEFFDVPPEKIHVVYHGTELKAPQPNEWEEWVCEEFARRAIPERYLLSVGTLEPRKNLTLLLHAAHQVRDKLRETNTKICFVGARGWKFAPVENLIAELQLQEFIVRPGYVPRALLPHLYARSVAFVYPSLYEGFGLPVLEALACGAPVITSNVSALPEVAGDAALLVDPQSASELAGAIQKVLYDEALQQQLRREGFLQARKFSWQKAARETIEVYQAAMN